MTTVWRELAFSDAFEVLSDHGRRVAQGDYLAEGPLPVVDQGKPRVGGFTCSLDLRYPGPLPVLVFGDHTRRIKYIDFPFAVGAQGVKLLRPRSGVSPKYAYWMLTASDLTDRGYGRHFALLRKKTFRVPDDDEQCRIVDILEDHLSRLDAAEQGIRASIRRSDSLRRSLLVAAFSGQMGRGPLDGARQEMTIEEVSTGGHFSDGDWVESKDQDPTGSVRLVQLADVGTGIFRNRSDRWMRTDQADRLGCTFLKPGDILIARMPDPIGRACLVPPLIGDAVTAVDVAILRVQRPDVLPSYAMWAINSPSFRSRVEALQSGTTRKRISRKNLAGLSISVPNVDDQRRIVDFFDDQMSRVDAGRAALEATLVRTAALRRAVLAAALSGRLTTIEDGVETESTIREGVFP